MRTHPITGKPTMHNGTDVAAATGTSVWAAAAGTVTTIASNSARGIYVVVDHGGGVQTWSQHLSATTVTQGQAVAAGALIGRVGSTGAVTGPHLHFEVHVNGAAINPQKFLAERGVTLGTGTPTQNPDPGTPTPTPTPKERTMRVIRAVNDPRVFSTDGVRLVHLTTQGQVNDMLRIAGQSEVDIVGQETVSTLGVTDDALVTKVWSRTLGAIAGADRTAGVGLRMAALAAAGQPVS